MSDMIHEAARDLPVVEDCDVCVLGGSCTGVFSAVRAANEGARTVIVEANGLFGGTATAGLVNVWHSLYDRSGCQQIIGGLTHEVQERLKQRGAVHLYGSPLYRGASTLNTAELAIELDKLVEEAGVRPFLHARFCAPLLEGDRLVGVAIEDKTGRRAIRARCFVDATGDADLVHRLGLPTRRGDRLQPPTTVMHLVGLDGIRQWFPNFRLEDAAFDESFPEALEQGFLWQSEVVGVPGMRMVAGTRVHHADCSDADELTRAEIAGRAQVRRIVDLLRRHFRGSDGVALAALPSHIGIRETRKADCLHRLTEKDLLAGTVFPDAIAGGTYPVDIHHSDRPGITFRHMDGREQYVVPGRPTEVGRWLPEGEEGPLFYTIPYRALVPRGAVNVLVAGRSIDTDGGAHGACRVMVNCNQCGEAAGVAAALAAQTGTPVNALDTQLLRDHLHAQGVPLL